MFDKIRIAIAVSVLSLTPQAYSLEIILNDIAVGGSSAEALAGFDAAASLWESLLSDDVTVRLDVGFEQLADGILGSTGSEQLGFFIQTFAMQCSPISSLWQTLQQLTV